MIVNNLTELRFLKVTKKFPEEFKMYDKFTCFNKIKQFVVNEFETDKVITTQKQNKSIVENDMNAILYLVLEFFALCNPFLQENVAKVFHRNGINF